MESERTCDALAQRCRSMQARDASAAHTIWLERTLLMDERNRICSNCKGMRLPVR